MMGTTIGGKAVGCDGCGWRYFVTRVVVDESKPAGVSMGTRRVVREVDGKAQLVEEPVAHETRETTTIAEWKCCADGEPRDLPACRFCSRWAAL